MQPVFTASEIRGCDTAAVERYTVPGIVLMENAARGAADFIEERHAPLEGRTALIVCGKGNNGGDGFAIARHLLNRGMTVLVFLIGTDDAVKGDARVNLDILRNTEPETSRLRVIPFTSVDALEAAFADRPAFLIDALLGTGLASPIEGLMKEIVTVMNGSGIPIVAIDIPTGISADTGEAMGACVTARETITMGGLKRGLLLGAGCAHSGELYVVDIGIPLQGYYETATQTCLAEATDISAWLPRRPFDAHKYQVGKVFAIAGSVGMTGAAALASEAALRAGAGIMRLGIPASLNDILEVKLTEVMTVPLPETPERTLGLAGFDTILEYVNDATVAIVGPGLSRHVETQSLIRRVIQASTTPLVIDADALFALVGSLDILRASRTDIVITPHGGEFARLAELPAVEIERRKIDLARSFAVEYGITVVLKGAPTVTACKDGAVYINSTGNPGMATAGSGDVLTGIIAGLMAQGLDPEHAAVSGVFIHGAAGDTAFDETGEHGLIAGDLIRALPGTMRSLCE
jgi:ADP-dependent NAD(P)H-hydrate dehydratase / NAD(P)H-hydrate epimerase